MPNGGTDVCYCCLHFDQAEDRCKLRSVEIEASTGTTCRNFGHSSDEIQGPLYAVVGVVRNRSLSYDRIPYYQGIRVETVPCSPNGDTIARFTDRHGVTHEFATTEEYIEFFVRSGNQL